MVLRYRQSRQFKFTRRDQLREKVSVVDVYEGMGLDEKRIEKSNRRSNWISARVGIGPLASLDWFLIPRRDVELEQGYRKYSQQGK